MRTVLFMFNLRIISNGQGESAKQEERFQPDHPHSGIDRTSSEPSRRFIRKATVALCLGFGSRQREYQVPTNHHPPMITNLSWWLLARYSWQFDLYPANIAACWWFPPLFRCSHSVATNWLSTSWSILLWRTIVRQIPSIWGQSSNLFFAYQCPPWIRVEKTLCRGSQDQFSFSFLFQPLIVVCRVVAVGGCVFLH